MYTFFGVDPQIISPTKITHYTVSSYDSLINLLMIQFALVGGTLLLIHNRTSVEDIIRLKEALELCKCPRSSFIND